MKTLVLFDIDGTLLDTHGAGRASFAATVREVLRVDDDCAYIRFAGATDLDLVRQIAERHRRPFTPELVAAFFAHLPVEMEKRMAEARLTIYPGVRELLRALDREPRALAGLVTGNIETCARIKLRQFGIDGHFLLGAFGHEHADRTEIARLALNRAQQKAGPIERAFLVGDTPSDIAAAKAIGAISIAVSTGSFTEPQLRQAGADHVLSDLSDTLHVLGLLNLSPP